MGILEAVPLDYGGIVDCNNQGTPNYSMRYLLVPFENNLLFITYSCFSASPIYILRYFSVHIMDLVKLPEWRPPTFKLKGTGAAARLQGEENVLYYVKLPGRNRRVRGGGEQDA